MNGENSNRDYSENVEADKIGRFARTGATVLKIFLAEKFHPEDTALVTKQAVRDVETGKINPNNQRIANAIFENVICDEKNTSFDKYESLPAKQIVDDDRGFFAVMDDMSREEISRNSARGKTSVYAPMKIPSAIFDEIYKDEERRREFTREIIETGTMQKYLHYWKPFIEMYHEDNGSVVNNYAKDYIKSLAIIKKFGVNLEDDEDAVVKELENLENSEN